MELVLAAFLAVVLATLLCLASWQADRSPPKTAVELLARLEPQSNARTTLLAVSVHSSEQGSPFIPGHFCTYSMPLISQAIQFVQAHAVGKAGKCRKESKGAHLEVYDARDIYDRIQSEIQQLEVAEGTTGQAWASRPVRRCHVVCNELQDLCRQLKQAGT